VGGVGKRSGQTIVKGSGSHFEALFPFPVLFLTRLLRLNRGWEKKNMNMKMKMNLPRRVRIGGELGGLPGN
jgi:hypothetical protein